MHDESIIHKLERYSLTHPQEVLVVHARIDDELDEIVIFKGFSSSLMRPTSFDLDVVVLPSQAEISSIDRLEGPLNPSNPKPIESNIPWSEFKLRIEIE